MLLKSWSSRKNDGHFGMSGGTAGQGRRMRDLPVKYGTVGRSETKAGNTKLSLELLGWNYSTRPELQD